MAGEVVRGLESFTYNITTDLFSSSSYLISRQPSRHKNVVLVKLYKDTKVILFVKNSLEVDGRGLSPYSQAPTHDPTQRLRGNPITLNLFLYCNINI